MRYADILSAEELQDTLNKLKGRIDNLEAKGKELSSKFLDCMVFGAECSVENNSVKVSSGGAVIGGNSYPIPSQTLGPITNGQYVVLSNPVSGKCAVVDAPEYSPKVALYTDGDFTYTVREDNIGVAVQANADSLDDVPEDVMIKDGRTGQLFVKHAGSIYKEKQQVELAFIGRDMNVGTSETEIVQLPAYISYPCNIKMRVYADRAGIYKLRLYDNDDLIDSTDNIELTSEGIVSMSTPEVIGHKYYVATVQSSVSFIMKSFDLLAVVT